MRKIISILGLSLVVASVGNSVVTVYAGGHSQTNVRLLARYTEDNTSKETELKQTKKSKPKTTKKSTKTTTIKKSTEKKSSTKSKEVKKESTKEIKKRKGESKNSSKGTNEANSSKRETKTVPATDKIIDSSVEVIDTSKITFDFIQPYIPSSDVDIDKKNEALKNSSKIRTYGALRHYLGWDTAKNKTAILFSVFDYISSSNPQYFMGVNVKKYYVDKDLVKWYQNPLETASHILKDKGANLVANSEVDGGNIFPFGVMALRGNEVLRFLEENKDSYFSVSKQVKFFVEAHSYFIDGLLRIDDNDVDVIRYYLESYPHFKVGSYDVVGAAYKNYKSNIEKYVPLTDKYKDAILASIIGE